MVYVGVLIVLRQPRRKGRVPCTPQISAYYASLVLSRTRAGAGSCKAALDLSSLSLIGAMRPGGTRAEGGGGGGGAGWGGGEGASGGEAQVGRGGEV